jgi:hypothetical protein
MADHKVQWEDSGSDLDDDYGECSFYLFDSTFLVPVL